MEPMEPTSDIKLTQYSHGAGCGCKIAPAVLHTMLGGMKSGPHHPTLLVGNDTKDDAAVVDLGDGTGIISTTDFFMPIVDDPHTFGRDCSGQRHQRHLRDGRHAARGHCHLWLAH